MSLVRRPFLTRRQLLNALFLENQRSYLSSGTNRMSTGPVYGNPQKTAPPSPMPCRNHAGYRKRGTYLLTYPARLMKATSKKPSLAHTGPMMQKVKQHEESSYPESF